MTGVESRKLSFTKCCHVFAGDLSRDHGLSNTALRAINMGLGQILHINWVLPLERKKIISKELQKVKDTHIYLVIYLYLSVPNYIIYYRDAYFKSRAIFIRHE